MLHTFKRNWETNFSTILIIPHNILIFNLFTNLDVNWLTHMINQLVFVSGIDLKLLFFIFLSLRLETKEKGLNEKGICNTNSVQHILFWSFWMLHKWFRSVFWTTCICEHSSFPRANVYINLMDYLPEIQLKDIKE